MNTTTRCAKLATLFAIINIAVSSAAYATIVEFETVLGNYRVNLFDNTTPATVNNFLNYVQNGAYSNSIVHRSVPGFVIQGGGYVYDGSIPLDGIPANAAVVNEPVLSNVRGTIAMAKLGGDPNSATNQWFISLADNSGSLDAQNGGFTVFGVVMDNGMDIVDAIAALNVYAFDGALNAVPLQNYNDTSVDPDENNIIIISSIVVTDSTVATAGTLPPANTTPAPAPTPVLTGGGGGGGGGSLGIFMVSMMFLLGVRRSSALSTKYFKK